MNSTSLVDAWRETMVDTAKPYLWSDEEALRYANDAYLMFVRLTGGIADFLSDACAADIVAGEAVSTLHPSILRVMSATRRSDNQPIEIINSTDLGKMRSSDYGQIKQLVLDALQGPVRYMVHGMKRGEVRWVQVPLVDDVCDMHVYRLPLTQITDFEQELDEIEEHHHIHLVDWMKHLAYKKQDADGFNAKASEQGRVDFEAYCSMVKSEWARYMHKNRIVSYGGL